MTQHEITFFILGLGALLVTARVLGELAERIRLPAVVGEISAGLILGPTLLGRIDANLQSTLFPQTGPGAIALGAFSTIAVVLFLLVAGLEIDLSTVWRQGKRAAAISIAGIVGPFMIGLSAAWYLQDMIGMPAHADPLIFALFFATAMSISALPVIAKALMDINLFRTDIGLTVVAAAVCNDLIGWIIFAILLGLMGSATANMPIETTIGLMLVFTLFMLTAGRWLANAVLPWVQAHTHWPGGVLGMTLGLGFAAAAFTEWIGVHAIFGAFMVGVAVGDSPHLRERTRATLEQFVGFIFAPIFFATLALRVDFVANFDFGLCLLVFVIATAGKLLGCRIGAWMSRTPPREAWAISFGMNARGAMEIILGLIALEVGLIEEPLFVALVVMALATSTISGPLMEWSLGRKRRAPFYSYLSSSGFIPQLEAGTRHEAIAELCLQVADQSGMNSNLLINAVWQHEQMMPAGLANRVAIPHAPIPGLEQPVVALGLSRRGVDFDAPDGQTARFICLLLTPAEDTGTQWTLLSEIFKLFGNASMRDRLLTTSKYTELRALLKLTDTEQVGPDEGVVRHGCVLAGASPLACLWARRLSDMGTSVWLVDSDRQRVDAAHRKGLNAIFGSATSEEVMTSVHAFEAQFLVAATANAAMNLEIAHFGQDAFAIPERIIANHDTSLTQSDGRPLAASIDTIWAAAIPVEDLQWKVVLLEADGILEPDALPRGFAPLIIERKASDSAEPVWLGMPLVAGDELHGIVHVD